MKPPLKTRFAPSPTGLLHLGNVRTALFNFLLARGAAGRFVLRIEDSDAARGHEQYQQALIEDLNWLTLHWDEGPGRDGPDAPYAQSSRGHLYEKYFAQLQAAGRVYPCFCTEQELKVERKTQIAAGRPPRYSGKCRGLAPDEVEERRRRGVPATLRFQVPDGRQIEFVDRVRGPQRFATADIGDFVVRRSDGTPAFFFCNALDDALMGVTLVVRGDDHLANTPRQLLLLEALRLPAPDYAHIPLVVGADGAPLSKRTGSRSLRELRAAGYLPAAVNNYLARVGHSYDEPRLLSLAELAARFRLERVHRSPARYDETQLLHWQREAVRAAPAEELWQWMGGEVQRMVPPEKRQAFVECMRANVTFPDDVRGWAEVLFGADTISIGDGARELIESTPHADIFERFLRAMDSLEWNANRFGKEFPQDLVPKNSFPIVRAALTNRTKGPEMWRVVDLLGERRVRARLEAAQTLLGRAFTAIKDRHSP